MAKLNFGGVEENVVTREEFPLAKAQDVLKNEIVAVIGYGVQGPGQALNQRENGINVIVGQRKNSKSWDKAVRDGFIPGVSLFEIEEALLGHSQIVLQHVNKADINKIVHYRLKNLRPLFFAWKTLMRRASTKRGKFKASSLFLEEQKS